LPSAQKSTLDFEQENKSSQQDEEQQSIAASKNRNGTNADC
jgi:hypothetical protein